MAKIHPKIQALRSSIGNAPVLYSHKNTRLAQPLETRRPKSDYEKRVLRQYFCIWGVPDDYGTVPLKGCWAKSIQERGPKSDASYKITALYMHNQRDSVGLPTVLEEDEVGLYAEVPVLEGIQVCDELLIRHQNGVCNNGSYGFNYIWDKMEYDEKEDVILMKELSGYEITFCTIGSQKETFGVRNTVFDDVLAEETEEFIRKLPRKDQLQYRTLIDRHITLAKTQPLEVKRKALDKRKPKQDDVDYDYLTKNFSLE